MNKTNLSKEAAVAEGREWIAPPSRDLFCIKDSLENSIKVSFEFILNYRISEMIELETVVHLIVKLCCWKTFKSWLNDARGLFIE